MNTLTSERFFELSIDLLCIAGKDGDFKKVSPSWSTTLGWSEEKLISTPMIEFVHPDERQELVTTFSKLYAGEDVVAFKNRFLTKWGEYRLLCWRASLDHETQNIYAIARDMTQQMLDEQLRLEYENRFAELMKVIPAGVFVTNSELNTVYVNDRLAEMVGLERSESLGRGWISKIYSEDKDRVLTQWQVAAQYRKPFYAEFRIQQSEYQVIWVSARGVTLEKEKGKISEFIGVIHDITSKKANLEELEIREQNFKALVEAIPGHVSWITKDLMYLGINQSLADSLGISPHEIIGKDVGFLGKDGEPQMRELLDDFFDSEQSELRVELKIPDHKSTDPFAEKRDFLITARKYFENVAAVLVGMDITDLKRVEKMLIKNQEQIIMNSKMLALGKMAAGIAHEVNNPLTVITSTVGSIQNRLKHDKLDIEKLKVDLSKIENTAFQIAKIITGLKTFSRNGEKEPYIKARINSIIEDTMELCKERFKNHNIDLKFISTQDFEVECSSVQISQVLINLLNNSFDAVETVEKKWIQLKTESAPSGVKIIVEDSGTGLPKELTSKLMEPFFTTKPVGKGTGLGLSISKGIIENHQGSFYFDENSAVTRFVVELPFSQKLVDEKKKLDSAA